MQTTLIIMAAGKSSRYGSLKQTEIIGPSAVTLMEYSIYDALYSGFTNVILIIRKETQSYFEEIKHNIGKAIKIEFVYQDMKQYTGNFKIDYQREKPWGTAHALLCCKDICNNPFVVINADDFYGKSSFEYAFNFFKKEKQSHLIIPYLLQNTLSENGTVNRGVCEIENDLLISIAEKTGLTKENTKGENSLVSMNFWGFQPDIFDYIEALFKDFLKTHQNPTDEFFIGEVVQHIIDENLASIFAIQSTEQWHGITYKVDKAQTHNALCQLEYPEKLWKLEKIAINFQAEGELLSHNMLENGLINDTYILEYSTDQSYILQKINKNVFLQPEKIMHNIQLVSSHLAKKREQSLEIVPTRNNQLLYIDDAHYWRMYKCIREGKVLDKVSTAKQCYSLGLAIGSLHKNLVDFPVEELKITLADFHNTKKIYSNFLKAIEQSTEKRTSAAKNEISFLKARQDKYTTIQDLIEGGEIPMRACHNDTKFSNVLLHQKTEQPLALIDLDTLMPHTILFDFADAIRTLAAGNDENETDLTKVNFNLQFFESFTNGFFEKCSNILTPLEQKHLAFSCLLITLEQAMRFITDFLEGDTYYKTTYAPQNLDRAKNQIHLSKQIEGNMKQMEEIICRFS